MSLLVTFRELWWMNQELLENQMVTNNTSEMVRVQGSLVCPPHRNKGYVTFITAGIHIANMLL
jgi:predicted GNAT family acetyltransferase